MGRLTRLRKTNNEVFYKFIATRKTDLDQAAKNKIIAEVNIQRRLTKPVAQSLYNKYRDAEEKIVSERNIFKKTFYYLKRYFLVSRFAEFNLQQVRFGGILAILKEKE